METKFTAGPWSAEPDPFGDWNILHPADALAVAAVVTNMRPADEVAANAHLISAAPDLFEALEWAMKSGALTYTKRIKGQNEDPCDAVDRARAALAKARGES